MVTLRDGRTQPTGIDKAWCHFYDRSRMALDTAPEMFTFVLHHHCRIPFHMLPEYLQR